MTQQPSTQQPSVQQSSVAVPREVHTAFVLWLGALAAYVVANLLGMLVVDTVVTAAVLRAVGPADPDAVTTGRIAAYSMIIGVIVLVIGLGLLLTARLRSGANWARIVLTVIGVLDVLVGAYGLVGGSTVPGVDGTVHVLIMVATVAELGLVAAAIWFMFRPPAGAYFAR